MAEPHDKVRSVRLTGGRLSGEHQRGTKTTVVISGTACPDCGSTLVRLSAKGDTCEGCRVKEKKEAETKKKKRLILEDCRNQAARASLSKILRMLEINTSALNRHRVSLRKSRTASYAIQNIISGKIARSQEFVDIWQEALASQLSSDANPAKRHEDRDVDVKRKHMLSRLSKGSYRTIDALLDESLRETLQHTYALSLLASQYGIDKAVAAFRSVNLSLEIPCNDKSRQRILQLDALLANPTRSKKSATRNVGTATRATTKTERRDSAGAQLLTRIARGVTTLHETLQDRHMSRTLGRCRLHDVIDALCADPTRSADIKAKIGGTSQRKMEDLSNLEVRRLIRLTETRD
ncbi:hypothetical protein [Streptomyces sp. VN1]|uniref:hypothetical protein n=1 Tax=Streptomyces sp. VN1 TaxID=1821625 RepID=UPI00141390FC|nr:hypothetical protein [Streptomyces sp. VN1]QIP71365.1 hypothetical protein EZV63_17130 [Streptomyces sp. VN1]